MENDPEVLDVLGHSQIINHVEYTNSPIITSECLSNNETKPVAWGWWVCMGGGGGGRGECLSRHRSRLLWQAFEIGFTK